MSTTSKKKKTTSKKDEDLPAEEDILMEAIDEEAPEISIDDLPGVGPATAEKLREAGFDELLALAVMSPGDLADQAELGEAVAGKIINAAKKMANIGGFVSGVALLDRRREVQKLSSKVQSIDDLLGGGFETQALVEVYGAFGSGKTQIGHQLAVNCTMPLEDGGFDGAVSIQTLALTFGAYVSQDIIRKVAISPGAGHGNPTDGYEILNTNIAACLTTLNILHDDWDTDGV